MIRAFLCRWFALHDMRIVSLNTRGHEISHCKHCGLYAAIENRTRRVAVLMSREEAER